MLEFVPPVSWESSRGACVDDRASFGSSTLNPPIEQGERESMRARQLLKHAVFLLVHIGLPVPQRDLSDICKCPVCITVSASWLLRASVLVMCVFAWNYSLLAFPMRRMASSRWCPAIWRNSEASFHRMPAATMRADRRNPLVSSNGVMEAAVLSNSIA